MGAHLNEDILREFQLPGGDVKMYSPLALAYIGDGVYELIVRSIILGEKELTVNHLHQKTSRLVNAVAQREVYQRLRDELTEEEQSVFRRGRNAKSFSVAKSGSVNDYRIATGLEALCGYLYLCGRTDRLLALLKLGIEGLEQEEESK